MKANIYDYSRESLEKYLEERGSKKFRATQIFEAIYRHRLTDFSAITNLKKEFRERMREEFYFGELETVKESVSADGTMKYLFRLHDRNLIETVLMRHDYGNSVCVTTQVGCNMGCLFCASGETKKIRDLSAGEMVMQALAVDEKLRREGERLSHAVIMG
ncbi:MAG: 23S rRNA (adenine(2503)-C(2))-methyltransferase RlmN, partial [Bacilli bacterium]